MISILIYQKYFLIKSVKLNQSNCTWFLFNVKYFEIQENQKYSTKRAKKCKIFSNYPACICCNICTDQKSDTNDKSLKTKNKYRTHCDTQTMRCTVQQCHIWSMHCATLLFYSGLKTINFHERKHCVDKDSLFCIFTTNSRNQTLFLIRDKSIKNCISLNSLRIVLCLIHENCFVHFFSRKIFIAAQIVGLYVYLPKVLYTINGYFLAGQLKQFKC